MTVHRIPRRLAAALLTLLALACAAPQRFEFEAPAMGTSFRVVLYADSAAQAERASEAAFARIRELDARLSDYRDDSELAQLSASSGSGAALPVSADLWRLLALSQSFSEQSSGAFDITTGPIVALWRRARRQGELPSPERLERARAAVGWRLVELDPRSRCATLTAPDMQLDLGGIAKGYALDAALDVLAEHGVERALVDGGGDIAVRRAPPGSAGWSVVVRPFKDESGRLMLTLENAAVATSGDAFQALELEGARYSHIVDPRSGQALSSRVSASVIAGDGASADALATALCVLGPEAGLELARRSPGVDARIARERDGAVESVSTPGFDARILSAPLAPPRNPTP